MGHVPGVKTFFLPQPCKTAMTCKQVELRQTTREKKKKNPFRHLRLKTKGQLISKRLLAVDLEFVSLSPAGRGCSVSYSVAHLAVCCYLQRQCGKRSSLRANERIKGESLPLLDLLMVGIWHIRSKCQEASLVIAISHCLVHKRAKDRFFFHSFFFFKMW